MKNLKTNKIMWFLIAVMSLLVSLIGVFNQDIYKKVVSNEMFPGVISQDLFTILLSIIVLFLIIRVKEHEAKKQMVILGIVSYLFYGYGIYTMEQLYTVLYLLYIAIFGLSFYSLIFSIVSIREKILTTVKQSKLMKIISIGFLMFVPFLFYPLWISRIIGLIETGQKLEFTFSVHILDLCFVMPLFIIIAIMVIKNIGLGLWLTPTLFIKGFTVLFPVGLGQFLKPAYEQSINITEAYFYLSLAIVFLLVTVFYLRNITLNGENSPS